MRILITSILFILLTPIAGGLLAGVDRVISARMQKRVGPSILQPFYDVLKLFQKENVVVNVSQNLYVFSFLFFTIFTGVLFFIGGDILLTVFSSTLAGIFFILGGYSTHSPYSFLGSERELISMVSDEPMVILMAIGMYMVTQSFLIRDIIAFNQPIIYYLPGVFIGYLFVLTIKMKKSPFDLSMSHHAHQEIVSGITTEFSGKSLALIEIAHWYENIFLLGTVFLFFAPKPILGVMMSLIIYLVEIFIDNTNARVKWQWLFKSSWFVALCAGAVNIFVLFINQS
ncbi:MAG: NADH-quinone oxidoreductase subunit H [Clostridiales bacterium]|nr:NADH-quinone oxidoreductase subunit H [Clostridiales bacterium]